MKKIRSLSYLCMGRKEIYGKNFRRDSSHQLHNRQNWKNPQNLQKGKAKVTPRRGDERFVGNSEN